MKFMPRTMASPKEAVAFDCHLPLTEGVLWVPATAA